MLQNSIIVKQRYERFIKKVCETEIVYGLKNTEGFATSESNDFEDENGASLELICFWSEKSLAQFCVKEEWSEYIPNEISLENFIENWCIGMFNDGLIIGINFDQNLFGFEIEPLELIKALLVELHKQGKELSLRKFKSVEELEQKINKLCE
jgi:hypothetical protein